MQEEGLVTGFRMRDVTTFRYIFAPECGTDLHIETNLHRFISQSNKCGGKGHQGEGGGVRGISLLEVTRE